jgi:hypothetical protein
VFGVAPDTFSPLVAGGFLLLEALRGQLGDPRLAALAGQSVAEALARLQLGLHVFLGQQPAMRGLHRLSFGARFPSAASAAAAASSSDNQPCTVGLSSASVSPAARIAATTRRYGRPSRWATVGGHNPRSCARRLRLAAARRLRARALTSQPGGWACHART